MNRKIIGLCILAIFVIAGLSQAGLSKIQPAQAQKAPPVQDFPEWYYDRFIDTIAHYDFEDGQLPEGWEYGDHTSGMHLQVTAEGCDAGNCYFWGFILPDGTFGHGNIWEDWLITPPIDLSGAGSAELTFRHKFNTESETDPIWDGHACWVRVDGTTWAQVHPMDADAYYDSLTAEELHCWGNSPGWTGERDWTPVTIDLSAHAGHSIEVNFLCVSDQLSSYDDGYEGVWIDDIVVRADGSPVFEDNAGDTGNPEMIFTGANTGAPWEVTTDNATLKTPPDDYDPGQYSLLGPENDVCLSHYIMTEWFTMPETGYPRSSFYRMADMPGFDWDDDNLLDDLAYIEMTQDGVVWEILFNTYGSGDNDSTFELIDWNDQQTMKYHAYRGEDLRLRFKVHADHEVSVGPGCERTEVPPCAGRGLFIDDFLMAWLGVPQSDIGIAYINVPYMLGVGREVPVEIGVMNLGSSDNNNAVTFFEILSQDTNFTAETFSVGDPLPGFPAPMGPPYPAIVSQDTFEFIYNWTPQAEGGYYWRALYFLPDELPEDDSLTVPTLINVLPQGLGEFSYVDRNVVSGSVPGFQPGNGPAIRYTIPDEFPSVSLTEIRHDWTGTWSPYEVHVYGPGPNDSTWGDQLIEPFVFGDDEPEPVFPADEPIIDLTGLPDATNLQGLPGGSDVWVHLRALSNTNLQIPQRGDPTEEGHDWLYFSGELSRNTQVWDVFVTFDTRGAGCIGLRGDPTGDGTINVLDILMAANHILGNIVLTGDDACRADCTGDNVINILDALGIANVILNVIPECPGACKPIVTPETLELMRSLESYLSPEAFSEIMALVKGEVGVPAEYSLAQNYPNPFNPTTSIQYTVAGNVQTSLQVYNVLGQEVVTLVNEMKAPGVYTVEWDATDLASGVYFYRLTAGDYTATRRMVLMK